jgi:hypothetical protein
VTSRRTALLGRLAAATLVAAAATVALPTAPAQAAYCSGGAGVSVFVDFGDLGGGTTTGCGGGATVASTAFKNAGVGLTPHPRQTSFVCQVQGKPANGDCMGTNAYWGFFVSDDGKDWVYASTGVYQQAVDQGDSVALVWQSSQAARKPGVAPAPAPKATPTKRPTKRPTKSPSKQPTKQPAPAKPSAVPSTLSATAASTESAAATPTTPTPTQAPSESTAPAAPETTQAPTGIATPTPTDAGATVTSADDVQPAAAEEDGGGVPGWLPPVIIAVLAAGAGGTAWVRARRAR